MQESLEEMGEGKLFKVNNGGEREEKRAACKGRRRPTYIGPPNPTVMPSFRLSGTTALGKRYYRSEFEIHRSGPRGRRAVLPLAVPLEVPQCGPNLTGSKAVPERYCRNLSYGT